MAKLETFQDDDTTMNKQTRRRKTEANETAAPITCRSIPFGALNRRMSDAFGEAIYPVESIHDTLNTLAWAANEHLIEGFSAWDDDIMPWSADSRGRVVDQQDQLLIRDIQDFMEDNEIRLTSFGCDLTREAVFANGALTNPSESIRQLAWRKLERAVFIANALKAESLRIFIGREGFEEPLNVAWGTSFTHLIEGLKTVNAALRHRSIKNVELFLGYTRKLRRHLFLSTPAQALLVLSQIDACKSWKICLEDNSVADISTFAVIAQCDALSYLPFGVIGNQGWTENIANTVQLLATLKKLGWQGIAECVGHPSRTEATPDDRELLKRQFITNSITALTIAIQQSEQLVKDWDKGLSPSEVGIMAALISANLNPDDILRKAISPNSPAETDAPPEMDTPQPIKSPSSPAHPNRPIEQPPRQTRPARTVPSPAQPAPLAEPVASSREYMHIASSAGPAPAAPTSPSKQTAEPPQSPGASSVAVPISLPEQAAEPLEAPVKAPPKNKSRGAAGKRRPRYKNNRRK